MQVTSRSVVWRAASFLSSYFWRIMSLSSPFLQFTLPVLTQLFKKLNFVFAGVLLNVERAGLRGCSSRPATPPRGRPIGAQPLRPVQHQRPDLATPILNVIVAAGTWICCIWMIQTCDITWMANAILPYQINCQCLVNNEKLGCEREPGHIPEFDLYNLHFRTLEEPLPKS